MSNETKPYDYFDAVSRNIGWVTREEQVALRGKRVAIAGLGGVGGVHLLTLTRMGIGKFSLAEFDSFEVHNFNRQVGAMTSTVGRPKIDVLVEMAKDINPDLDIRTFPQGVNESNIESFLDGVDVYVDGIDYFAFDARRATYAACARKGIAATIAVPVGMGASAMTFLPGGMTFDDYFGMAGHPELEQAIRFLVGISPAMLQRTYVADPSTVNLAQRRGPSTPMACQLCSGIAATEAVKILLGRGEIIAAPHGFHFDAYRNKYVKTWRPGGNRNPIQRLMLSIIRRQLKTMNPAGNT